MIVYKVIVEHKKTGTRHEISFKASDYTIAERLARAAFDRRKYKIVTFYGTESLPSHQICAMCGNEWKSLNDDGYCSSCWQVWNS